MSPYVAADYDRSRMSRQVRTTDCALHWLGARNAARWRLSLRSASDCTVAGCRPLAPAKSAVRTVTGHKTNATRFTAKSLTYGCSRPSAAAPPPFSPPPTVRRNGGVGMSVGDDGDGDGSDRSDVGVGDRVVPEEPASVVMV